jgi:hypothetical protein
MKVAVAVLRFQDPAAFQEEPDVEIVGHTDAAMHLDGLGGGLVRGRAELGLGQAGQFRKVLAPFVQRLSGLEYHGLAHFDFRMQLSSAVLQRLEADGYAELFALLQVIHRAFESFLGDAQ